MNSRVHEPGPQWTRQCIQKREIPILDDILIKHGGDEEMKVHVCVVDAGNTDHHLIWTDSQQTKDIKDRRGKKRYKWRIDEAEIKEIKQEFQE